MHKLAAQERVICDADLCNIFVFWNINKNLKNNLLTNIPVYYRILVQIISYRECTLDHSVRHSPALYFENRIEVRKMLENGTVLKNRYRITGQLGVGGTSYVYLAVDLSIQKWWAVKQILYKKEVSVRFAEQEVLMMKQLDYRMFPRIVDAWQEETCCFIVSDYIDGISLDVLLRHRKIPNKTALVWSMELAGALRYLHEREPPVLYLDLKPENIMVKPDGSLILIDFGIARRIAEGNCEFGTPGYAAPEQYHIREGGGLSPQADIFAFGMTLYAMLSGRVPDLRLSVQTQNIKKDRTIKRKLKHLLLRCIHTNLRRRFQNDEELLSALKRIRENNHKTKILFTFSILFILLFMVFLPLMQRYDARQKQNAAAERMLEEAEGHMEGGNYTKEGIKIICGYLNSGCLSEAAEQQFLYEAARNYFEQQHNYKEAKRYFERLDEKAYPEKQFFLELCKFQTEFTTNMESLNECLAAFYEYSRAEGFSERKYENELLIAAFFDQPGCEKKDVEKAVYYLEKGMQELTAAQKEEAATAWLRAEYARRLCMLYERLEEYNKMHFYGDLAMRLLPKEEETVRQDISERLARKKDKE